jgi:hypothetical protein
MKNVIKYLTVAAAVVGCAGSALATPSGAAIELISGSTTIIVQDNGVGDSLAATGGIIWGGQINGWTLVITSGQTKPISGSATTPNMDLSVDASPGGALAGLTVMFTDTDFGPSFGLADFNNGNNGTAAFTSAAYYSTSDAQFALGNSIVGSGNLSGPYSITIVDTYSIGTISTDDRVTTVPDGGATVMLLGAALSAIGLFRKKLIA